MSRCSILRTPHFSVNIYPLEDLFCLIILWPDDSQCIPLFWAPHLLYTTAYLASLSRGMSETYYVQILMHYSSNIFQTCSFIVFLISINSNSILQLLRPQTLESFLIWHINFSQLYLKIYLWSQHFFTVLILLSSYCPQLALLWIVSVVS